MAVNAPQLDSALWGTVEKKADKELMLYDFNTDIVTNPYSGWYVGFGGAYMNNFVKQDPAAGAPRADDARKALPANLQPKPQTADMSIYDVGNIGYQRGMMMYSRSSLQHGEQDEEGDRYMYLERAHDWYSPHKGVANNALRKLCGLQGRG